MNDVERYRYYRSSNMEWARVYRQRGRHALCRLCVDAARLANSYLIKFKTK